MQDKLVLLDLAVAGAGVAAGLVALVWALAERRKASRAQLRAKGQAAGARAALMLRETLLVNGRDAVVVWDRLGRKSLCTRQADQLLRDCLDGADGATLSAAVQALHREGKAFSQAARDPSGRMFSVRGCPVGASAVVWVEEEAAAVPGVEPKEQAIARQHLLDRLYVAVAQFGAGRKLEYCNAAFAQLWGLPQTWLDARPHHGELLDRLRETGKLPERRDYQSWKRQRLALYAAPGGAVEECWSLRDGRTLRVNFCVDEAGRATILCDDVTEKLGLESSLKMQVAAQSATLDALGEAVAAFGPDGRLALHNAAFAEIWDLERTFLAGRPHMREVADACLAKFGDEAMWDRLVATVSSSPAQRRHWRKIHRSDGVVLSLATMPLPDRATLVTFTDMTDRFGLEAASRERNEALEMLDHLRTDYIKQLSHELRTPLNTVLGFAEQLAADERLDLRTREQAGAIVSGAYALKRVADGMLAGLVGPISLSKAMIDSAAMQAPPQGERRKRAG